MRPFRCAPQHDLDDANMLNISCHGTRQAGTSLCRNWLIVRGPLKSGLYRRIAKRFLIE